MDRFVLLIKKHKFFGDIFVPYFVHKEKKEEKYAISRRILPDHEDTDVERLPELYREIIKTIGAYDDHVIKKIFHKDPQINLKAFFQSLDNKRIDRFIRPYIEKRLVEVVRLLQKTEINVFLHEGNATGIYNEDRILLARENLFVTFHFNKNNSGTDYFVSLREGENELVLTGKKHLILTNKPCVLILEGRLYLLEDMEGKKLEPFFKKESIHIPVRLETKYYHSFIRDILAHYKVTVEGFEVMESHTLPGTELSLENGLNGLLVMILTFRYEDIRIQPDQNRMVFVTLEETEQGYRFNKIFRNKEYENKVINRLAEIGFEEYLPGIFTAGSIENNPKVQHYEMISFINRHSTELKKEGLTIHQKGKEKYLLDGIRMNVKTEMHRKENRLIDWFGLHAEVQLGKYSIPFVWLKDHILNKKREYILPDGSIAVIPEEWFAEYENLLQFGEVYGEEIRIRSHHFPLLKEMSAISGNTEIQQRMASMMETENVVFPLPAGFRGNMRPYQRKGYGWLMNLRKHGLGGCLADDMGLGKTIQSIALIQKIRESGKPVQDIMQEKKPNVALEGVQLSLFDTYKTYVKEEERGETLSLIVVPKTLIFNWVEEIIRFAPGLKVLVYAGSDRQRYFEYFDAYDVVVVTYGLLRRDIGLFCRVIFDLIILDESRYIKNPASQIFKAVIRLQARQRVILTGTPVENSLTDLWTQMHFVNPGLLGGYRFFMERFVNSIEHQHDEQALQTLRRLIGPFMLRRTKQEVARDLPDITEQHIFTEMSVEQAHFYEEENARVRNAILKLLGEGRYSKLMIPVLQGLTRLRLAANHPVLVDDTYTGDSGKFEEAMEIIRTIVSEGHKILVFSSFVKVLKLFEKQFIAEDVPYVLLTGSISQKQRKNVVKSFNDDGQIRVFLISVMAGGFGLNLVAADYVVILDPWWNPAVEQQAIDRTHRIGQTRNVMVYKLIGKETIEEKIMLYQEHKAHLAQDILQVDESMLKQMNREEIAQLFE